MAKKRKSKKRKKSSGKKRSAGVPKNVRSAARTITKHLSKLKRVKEKQEGELSKTKKTISELQSLV